MAIYRHALGQARVVGLQYHHYQAIASQLVDGLKLRLVPEADNPHDPNAVVVYLGADQIGYIERNVAGRIVAMLKSPLARACYASIIFHDPDSSMYNRLVVDVVVAIDQPDEPPQCPNPNPPAPTSAATSRHASDAGDSAPAR